MNPVGFEPTISAGERPQTYALDRAAIGNGIRSPSSVCNIINFVALMWNMVQLLIWHSYYLLNLSAEARCVTRSEYFKIGSSQTKHLPGNAEGKAVQRTDHVLYNKGWKMGVLNIKMNKYVSDTACDVQGYQGKAYKKLINPKDT